MIARRTNGMEGSMRRKIVGVGGVAALTGTIALAVPALAANGPVHKNVHFTVTVVGAPISHKQAIYKLNNSVAGNGAAVETQTGASAARGVEYYVGGTVHYTDTSKLGKPNSAGVIPVTGIGHELSGTGIFKHIRGHFSLTGTVNTKTGIVKATIHGVESY